MNYLALAQMLRREGRFPGTGPETVIDQTGDALDIVSWIRDRYRNLQQEHAGSWKWLRRPWTFNTVAGTDTYAYTAITDSDAAAVISRPGRFIFDVTDLAHMPQIYLTSDGASAARRMACPSIDSIRARYGIGTHSNARPTQIAADDRGRIVLKPTPDDIYTVSGWYFRGPQVLAEDDDEPEMPEEYHELIVWAALVDYGYNDLAQELIQRAERRGRDLWTSLVRSQLVHRFGRGAAPLV